MSLYITLLETIYYSIENIGDTHIDFILSYKELMSCLVVLVNLVNY